MSETRLLLDKNQPPKKKKLALSNTEKAVAGVTSVLTGAGVGGGVAFGVYSLITASIGVGGLGVTMTALAELLTISGAGILSMLIAIPVAYWAYTDYMEIAKGLNDEIQRQKDKTRQRNKELETALFDYFIALLRLRCILAEQEFNKEYFINWDRDIIDGYKKSTILDLVRDVYAHLSPNNELIGRLQSGTIDDRDRDQLKQQAIARSIKPIESIEQDTQERRAKPAPQSLYDSLRTPSPKSPKPSYGPAIKTGAIGFMATFSGVLSMSFGISALVMGMTAAAIATPIVGWALLAGSALIGLIVGGALAYYRHKNSNRETERVHFKGVNKQLKEQQEEIKADTNRLNHQMLNQPLPMPAENRERPPQRKRAGIENRHPFFDIHKEEAKKADVVKKYGLITPTTRPPKK